MAFDDPLWLQDIDYPARLDRALIEAFGIEGVVSGLKVVQRAAGANFSVDVGIGTGIVQGDDQADQGSYFVRNKTVANVAIGSPPGSGQSRIDAVCVRVRDTQAGGPAGAVGEAVVIAGTAGASPTAPALPNTAVLLAWVTVPNGLAAVTTAQITDKRVLARPQVVVSPTAPSDALTGLIWLKPV